MNLTRKQLIERAKLFSLHVVTYSIGDGTRYQFYQTAGDEHGPKQCLWECRGIKEARTYLLGYSQAHNRLTAGRGKA